MMDRRFCKCVTVVLVHHVQFDGSQHPSTGTATVGSLGFPRTVDLTGGKFYDGVQQTKSAYGEHDNRQGRLNRSG